MPAAEALEQRLVGLSPGYDPGDGRSRRRRSSSSAPRVSPSRSRDRRPARPGARAPARADRADRLRELHLAERSSRRSAARRPTSTPRATPASATTAAARSSTRSSRLAIDRAKSLFGAEHANVQPHAGAQTNMAVYMAALKPGDTILSLELSHGGHLTHGLKVNFSGRLYTIVHYGVCARDEHGRLRRRAPTSRRSTGRS